MKKIKIFGTPWHLGHQYELFKIPWIEWSWLIQLRRQYGTKSRGEFNVNWVTHYEPGKYDLALLHLDQQCFEETLWEIGKGSLYKELNEEIQDIPKIVIMHGTPHYPEVFQSEKEIVELAKKAIGNNTMVTNSYRAAEQWGLGNPIWHGMSPEEWFDLPKEPRVVTMIGPGGLDSYYDRQFLRGVKEVLADEGIIHCHITVDFISENWADYRKFLGASLVYFNPTRESPMPRARTEAMFSGCCVLTTNNQDADKFIKHGENGFFVKRNPDDVSRLVQWCFQNYNKALAIGQKGKETAIKLFNWDRFEQDWRNLIEKVLNRKIDVS